MKIPRVLIVIFAVAAAFSWIIPAGISLYMVKNASAVASVTPANLKESSVSQAPGTTLTYFGHEFEVPWSDLDKTETKVMKDQPDDHMAWICFRSGLKMFVVMRSREKTAFSYDRMKDINGTTPEAIHYWVPFSNRTIFRQLLLLQLKSDLLREIGAPSATTPAESGIFNVYSSSYMGFQYGNPVLRPGTLDVALYSQYGKDDSKIEIKFLQTAYEEPVGVTQPEINRIIQSMHRVSSDTQVSQR